MDYITNGVHAFTLCKKTMTVFHAVYIYIWLLVLVDVILYFMVLMAEKSSLEFDQIKSCRQSQYTILYYIICLLFLYDYHYDHNKRYVSLD